LLHALKARWHRDTLRREKTADVAFDLVKYLFTAAVVGSWLGVSGVTLAPLLVGVAIAVGAVLVAIALTITPPGSR
jgi:hypothetical protein